ncbi:hypothetical protein [Mesorhizobium australafricanum]|uniref:Uncharacterized protein n=1 Tax=Mesorhizobium australafricanum TaxID=3072311 RepID=A0ABU4X7B3_9HYPH|nr:hypothetical protein [Mesorhizobium sp. VK3E]MDX8443150.1 hypothetical protein [Mesorhizobium sp. VK3E]
MGSSEFRLSAGQFPYTVSAQRMRLRPAAAWKPACEWQLDGWVAAALAWKNVDSSTKNAEMALAGKAAARPLIGRLRLTIREL